MSRQKKPTPVFELLFDSPDVLPEAIPLGTLTQALSAIRQLASGNQSIDDDDDEIALDDSSGSIRLLDIHRGSAVFRFVCPKDDGAIGFLRGAGRVLENPEEVGQNDYILNPIERLSATARRMNCRIILREAGGESGILATIKPDSYKHISDTLFITGDTSFAGYVERVGGATSMKCALRVSFQTKLLFCSVENKDVSRQLGEYLYRDVAVHGEARWIKGTWKVTEFKIKRVTKLDKQSLGEAFRDLRDAGGSGWDSIDDPRSHIEGVCGI